MPGYMAWRNRGKRVLGCAAVLTAILATYMPAPGTASVDSVVATEIPKVELQLSGMPVFSPGTQLCTRAVSVCARELQPMGVEIGGTFTVKISGHYKSTYECGLVDGIPTWVPTAIEGSCEAQPVIFLPAKYDVGEAWNVG